MFTLADVTNIIRSEDIEETNPDFAVTSFTVDGKFYRAMHADVPAQGPEAALRVMLGMLPPEATMVFETDADGNPLGVSEATPFGNDPVVALPNVRDFDAAKAALINLLNE